MDEKLTGAANAEGISKGELLRRSVAFYFASNPTLASSKKRPTLHDGLKKYIPKKGAGIRDLATNLKVHGGLWPRLGASTLDSDFSVYRRNRRQSIPLISPQP